MCMNILRQAGIVCLLSFACVAGYGLGDDFSKDIEFVDRDIQLLKGLKIKLSVNAAFQYVDDQANGARVKDGDGSERTTKVLQTMHMYATKDEDPKQSRVLLVRLSKMKDSRWYFYDDLLDRMPKDDVIEKGKTLLAGVDFKYVVFINGNNIVRIKEKAIGTPARKRFEIIYAESLPTLGVRDESWKNLASYTNTQRDFLDAFMKRSDEAIEAGSEL